jgi:hypothetical protein
MNADERGFSDSLTERVLGAVFGVSNNIVHRYKRSHEMSTK